MNVQKIIRQTLYERKEKRLTIFYKVDVSITENLEKEQELEQPMEQPQVPEVPIQQPQVQQLPLTQMPNEETIYEETFTSKAMGKLQVSEDEIDNIQSLEDLMDYLSNKSVKGNPVLNDGVAEIILNMAANGAQSIADLISKDDKIYISVDYGKDKDDSIGFKAIKSSGLNTLSLVLKKDNKILPGQFNLQEFNRQIIFFRNSVIGD
jgi:hypothetical protein